MKALLALFCTLLVVSGCYEELDWRELQAEDRSFIVLLPDSPKKIVQEVPVGETRLQLNMLVVENEGMAFGVAYADVPPDASLNLVRDARDSLLRNIQGQILSEKLVEVNGAQGIEFRAGGRTGETSMLLAARILRNEKRFYQISFVGRTDRAEKVDLPLFLESFKPL